DPGEERLLGVVEVGLVEVVADRARVRLEARLRIAAKRARLAREDEPAAVEAVVERLDAEAVARAEESSTPAVPERERPHPVEPLDARVTPLLVGGEDHLGVGGAVEAAALRLELGAQLAVVVDLTVVDELQRAVLACKRLQAGIGEVDDREPAKAERDAVDRV